MFKKSKSVYLVMLCIAVFLSTNLLTVISFAVPQTSNIIKIVEIKGTLKLDSEKKERLILVADDAKYNLIGNTSSMSKFVDTHIMVKGFIRNTFRKESMPTLRVISFTPIENPIPTIIPTPIIIPITKPTPVQEIVTQGMLSINDIEGKHFELTTKDGEIFVLVGKTEGIEKYVDQTIEIKGYVNDGPNIWMRGKVIEVISYAPVALPTPEIKYDIIMGRLEVLKIDSSEVIKIGSPYQFHLETETTPYTLQGNTEGLEKYDGQKIEVTGTVSPLKIYPPIFNVVSYKPIIEPRYDVLQGLLTVLKPEPSEEIVLDNPYKFQLETEKGAAYSLIGDTKGLEQYNGQTVEVKGNYVPTLLPQYPGLFNVVSYTPIVPVPTPVPTPVSPSNVHTIISEKPLGFSEPISGAVGNFTENLAGGSCTISWVENTGKAFFNAKLTVINDENQKVDYEFELATVKISGKDSIKGLFNVKRNGELVAKEISGELYGLNQPVGSYFKFYSSDTNWHMSAYITNRIDF